MASVAVFVPCSRYYLTTCTFPCVAAAVCTWAAEMGAPLSCPHGSSPSRCPSKNKTEQHQRVVCMGRQVPVIVKRLAHYSCTWKTFVPGVPLVRRRAV